MSLVESLKKAQIFTGLSPEEFETVATLCQQRTYKKKEVILSEGETSRELFVIDQGTVEVSLTTMDQSSTPLINLGEGQVFGEMTLVDRGARSATVKAMHDPTVLHVIPHKNLLELCEDDLSIGFKIMRNLAAEMSLKLRYRNIAAQMDASG